MSGFQGHDRDFSRYNHMSTEELEEILRADFALPEEEESDMEKILYITEVIASRRAGQPTGRYANADEAWKSFVENYLPSEDQAVFCETGNAVEEPKTNIKRPLTKLWRTILVRVATIVVAVVLVVSATTATASAFGFDFWAWVNSWSQELLGIRNPNTEPGVNGAIPEQLAELHAAMKEYGFPENLLPTYLPDGYTALDVKCDAKTTLVNLYCLLEKDDNAIIFDYTMYLSSQMADDFQKDEDNPDVYRTNGTDHYIMTNNETYYTVWTVDNVECFILGVASREELIQIIDSIYGGNP